MTSPGFQRLALIASILALCVVVLGAYVRLSHAGLGCPDWPGCYGQISVPTETTAIASANVAYPDRPVEAPKAWKEMIHRYFAGTLGLLVLALAIWAWRRRKEPEQPVGLPVFLVGLIVLQALLGMWTVTLLLKPVVVMAHLLGGMATLALLVWLTLRVGSSQKMVTGAPPVLIPAASFALIVLVMQIALGGWTSANYAALVCYDLPTCQEAWWPPMDFAEGFKLWREIGIDYEGGILGNDARVAIHVAHRIGAIIAFLVIGWAASKSLARSGSETVRRTSMAVLGLLMLQIGLGIANVLMSLPLPVAAAHNGVAALLLISLVTLNYRLRQR